MEITIYVTPLDLIMAEGEVMHLHVFLVVRAMLLLLIPVSIIKNLDVN